jgi:glycosyltransferase involved in cell wall biosynthesis
MKNIIFESKKYDNLHNTSSVTVSWLLCTHVANEYLRLAIKSCLEQSFHDFELLIIANGSEADEIAATISNWYGDDSKLRIFTTEIRHLVFSLNLGLHHARGNLIARMDGDDISKFDRLERQVLFMLNHPEVAVLGSSFYIIDDQGDEQCQINQPLTNEEIRRKMLVSNPFCHPTIMFRRDIVLSVGGYLGGLHAEDYDLWIRLALINSCEFRNLPDACLGYRSVGVGNARRSRLAYSSVAASQLRNFLLGFGVKWLVSSLYTIFKALIRSKPMYK